MNRTLANLGLGERDNPAGRGRARARVPAP